MVAFTATLGSDHLKVGLSIFDTLQKNQEFWTVSNRPEIGKNSLQNGPNDFFFFFS
jgi:hypothetical protein